MKMELENRRLMIFVALMLCLLAVATGREYRHLSAFDANYSFTKSEKRNQIEVAKFLSDNQTLSVEVGGLASFPCAVRKKNEEYKMIFKFVPIVGDDRIIYAGEIKVTHFPRMVKKKSSFTLKNIHKSDTGSYICRFETNPVMQLVHKLDVRYPAEVHRVGTKSLTVTKGAKTTLRCSADGNPKPLVTWSREEGPLTSGSFAVAGQSITLNKVDLTEEGRYICRASNGIGTPATSYINLHVEYMPEITTEQSIEFPNHRVEAHLLCRVYGRPSPDVTWSREGSPVSSEKHFMSHDTATNEHKLTIQQVTEDDFGEYTCTARNIHGLVDKRIVVTGIPKQPKIVSSPSGYQKTSYILEWQTESFASIMQYRLRYRKAPLDIGKRTLIPWVDYLYTPMEINMIRSTRVTKKGVFHMKHELLDLQPSEDYEATVRVENKYGWSNESDPFHFYTRKKISLGLSTSSAESHFWKMNFTNIILSSIFALLSFHIGRQ